MNGGGRTGGGSGGSGGPGDLGGSGRVVRGLLYRTSLGFHGPWVGCLEDLRHCQGLGEDGARRLAEERLERLLEHAARHVPYYRDLVRQRGLLNRGRLRAGAIEGLPLLDRATLRREFDRLRSDDLSTRAWRVNATGGSTGEPVRFIQDLEVGAWRTAVELLFDEWCGALPGVRRAALWGTERGLVAGSETLRSRFRRWRRNEIRLNSFRMTAEQMRRYAERLDRWRPQHLLGYADSLYEFSCFLERCGIRIHAPRSIMSSSGTLLPHQRDVIARVLGAPVFDRYASREFGGIAAEDGEGDGLVVASPHVRVEVLRPDGSAAGPLEEGELVVTSLTNFAMPLIRYRIGDRACWSERPSRRSGWPALARISGRVTDTFVRPDGGVVSPLFFIHLVGVVLDSAWIRRFQVIQESPNRVIVRLVLEPPLSAKSPELVPRTREIAEKIRAAMGLGCAVEFDVRDEIPVDPSGKFRYAISRVAPPWNSGGADRPEPPA